MTDLRFTKIIQSLPSTVPFVGPEALERARGKPFMARIGANENVFGPSPKAVKAMENAAADVWKYGDPESFDLRHALSGHHGVPVENILIGEGIDGILGDLVRLFIEPGDAVVTSSGAYPTFNYHVAGYGGKIHAVPYRDDHEDPDALLAKARETGAKLIYLANPDNPMASLNGPETIAKMIAELPSGCLLILDEAYIEFAPQGSVMPWDAGADNVLRLRTFSKAYAMAGARVGYAIGPQNLIDAFGKVRNHFGMCRISHAGALAALQDQDHLSKTISDVETARTTIAKIAANNGFHTLASATNFVAIDCGQDGDFARAVLAGLEAQDIFVRMPFVAPQDRCIRISAGRPTDMAAFAAALPLAIEKA